MPKTIQRSYFVHSFYQRYILGDHILINLYQTCEMEKKYESKRNSIKCN